MAEEACCAAAKTGYPAWGQPTASPKFQGLGGPIQAAAHAALHRNLRRSRRVHPESQRAPHCFLISIQIMGLPDLTATVPKLQQNCFGNCVCKPFSLRKKSALG
jgi:hypothetical protein